jgi:Flp pilus assembly protein TadG
MGLVMALQITQSRMTRFLGRFRRAKKGATAVEFALIAAPFFFLLFAIVEITMVFFTSTALDHASMDVARKIRTGEFQSTGASSAEFVTQVCDSMSGLIACNGNVSVDIRTFADFGDVVVNNPIDANGNLNQGAFQFDPGNAGDIVLVRVFYSWQLSTPMIGTVFANLANNRRLIVSSLAFRNEPFGA